MPEIKYSGAPTQTPEEARRTAEIPGYRLSMPDIRFTRAGAEAGAEIGRATGVLGATMHTLGASIDSLGKTMSGAGDELFNRALGLKQLETETTVNNATIAWEQAQIKKDEEFKKTAGEQANSQALEAHLKTSEEDRQKFRNSMPSPQAQKMFDQQTTRPYLQFARTAAAHVSQETKTYAKQTVESRLGILGNRMAASKEDKDFYEGAKEGYKIFMDERRFLHGQDEATAKVGYMEWYTKSIAAWAERLSTDGDNARAMKILEDNKEDMDKIDTKMFTEVYKKIKDKNDRDMAYTAADKAANSGKPDDTYEMKEKRLMDEIKRIGREGDINFTREAITNLRTREAIDQHKQNQLRERAWEATSKALHNPAPGQQEPPKTEKEFMGAITKEQWEALSEAQKRAAKETWEANALGNYPETLENRAEWHYWRGSLLENPKELIDKVEKDPAFIDKLKMPKEFRNQLYNQYLAAKAQGIHAEEDTRVARVYNYGLNNFLITKNINDKKDLRQRFKSYLSSELDQWHQEHPKQMPKAEDYKEMINKARNQVITHKGFLWDSTREQYFAGTDYRMTPGGKAFAEKYKKDNPGITPSDEEINKAFTDAYVRGKIKLLEGTAAPPKSSVVAPKSVPTVKVGPSG